MMTFWIERDLILSPPPLNVIYDLVELGYNDKNGMQLHCFYCEVPIDAQFLLSGVCEYTYFGKDH